jgi:hypothetical protein
MTLSEIEDSTLFNLIDRFASIGKYILASGIIMLFSTSIVYLVVDRFHLLSASMMNVVNWFLFGILKYMSNIWFKIYEK